MPSRRQVSFLSVGPLLAAAQSWLHVPQTPGPLGDYTSAEREVVQGVDPGVEGSSTALNSHTNFSKQIRKNGWRPMHNFRNLSMEEWTKKANVKVIDPTVRNIHGTNVVLTDHGLQPVLQMEFWAAWNLTDRPRMPALLVEDMIEGYRPFVGYLIPAVMPLLAAFRGHDLPVFWSNWLRRPDDGLYGSLDRYYGDEGISQQVNPAYIYGENDGAPMSEIKPTPEEVQAGRVLKSAHLSKFADLDSSGHSHFMKLLKAAGVDTLVVVGAWTEDCLPATTLEGLDKYNVDMVVVTDGVGTATASHFPALNVMGASSAKLMTSAEVTHYINEHGSDDAYILRDRSGAVLLPEAQVSNVASGGNAVEGVEGSSGVAALYCALLAAVAVGAFVLGRVSVTRPGSVASREPFLGAV